MRECVSGPGLDPLIDTSRCLEDGGGEREHTAHLVAASLTFSVFCSEKPE